MMSGAPWRRDRARDSTCSRGSRSGTAGSRWWWAEPGGKGSLLENHARDGACGNELRGRHVGRDRGEWAKGGEQWQTLR